MVSTKMFYRRVFVIGTIIFLLNILILTIWKYPLNRSVMSRWKDNAMNIISHAREVKSNVINMTVNSIYDCLTHTPDKDIVNSTCLKDLSSKSLNERQNDSLLVIVILHSHNDPGYKKTYDQYFAESTSKTLTLAVEKLHEYRDLTFVWPETCFLERWWKKQSVGVQGKFKDLVKTGRFEIAAGTWVIADEALSHYFSFLDQLLEGHYWLKRHLGVTPTVSFDLDQFSLSSSVRYLLRVAGIKNTVLKRIHMGVKSAFMKEHWMNFYWRQSWDTDKNQNVFVQVEPYEWLSFPDSCGPSRQVCDDLDMSCVSTSLPEPGTAQFETPIRLRSHQYSSLHDFADKLIGQFKLKSAGYQHGVLLLPLGDDFRYSTASEWDNQYNNMNILMKHINEVPDFNVHMKYGTLQEYFDEVKFRTKLYDLSYPTISGDFLPFTLDKKYWSGYYSNRQYLKVLGSQLQALVRAADILAALLVLSDTLHPECSGDIFEELTRSRRELDLFQHHDAITGTVERKVAKDFENRVRAALSVAESVLQKLTANVLFADGSDDKCGNRPNMKSTFLYSVDEYSCVAVGAMGSIVLLNLYTQERRKIFCIKTKLQQVQIIREDGSVVHTDINQEQDLYKIYFEAVIPPLSVIVYQSSDIDRFKNESAVKPNIELQRHIEKPVLCENPEFRWTFSVSENIEISMCNKRKFFCTNISVEPSRYTYSGGAYTFPDYGESVKVPDCDRALKYTSNAKVCSVIVDCKLCQLEFVLPLVDGIHGKYLQVFSRIDLSNSLFKGFRSELALRIQSQIQNGRTFYTDSIGLYLQKREFRRALPFGASVFPMTSQAVIEDRNLRLSVHSAEPHGVVSRAQGTLDIILDRVAVISEPGLYQGVDDNQPTVTKFYIFIEKLTEAFSEEKAEMLVPTMDSTVANDHILHPVFGFFIENVDINSNSFTFLKEPFPPGVIIANMKCLTTDDPKFDHVSLTLYKRSALLSSELDHISVKDLFTFSGLRSVDKMLDKYLNPPKYLPDTDNISVKAMGIKTIAFRPNN